MTPLASPPRSTPKRYHELDSLRGVAAATVVLHHFLYVSPSSLKMKLLHGPARILIAGHEAVILFFMLSGFVLTLPYTRRAGLDYASFLLKRFCRIYLPYLAAMALAVAADLCLPAFRSDNTWINSTWSQPVTASLVAQHVLFLGFYDWAQFNTAFWSLVIEMRVSLVFPLLAWFVLRVRTGWSVGAAVLLSAGTILATPALARGLHADPADVLQQTATFHYAAFFLVGAVLARNLEAIDASFRRLHPAVVAVTVLASLLLYAPLRLPVLRRMPVEFYDWGTAAGAFFLILLAINPGRFYNFLTNRAIHHLGTVSYSLYLVHGTALFALIHLGGTKLPTAALFALYLLLTALLTEIFYRWVELPTMRLGRRLTSSRRKVFAEVSVA